MLSIRTVLSLFLLMLMGSLFVAHAEGQTATPSARILWQKELGSDILQRRYIGHAEPDVGIVKDGTRTNPIRMAATRRSVYLFDDQGNIERQVSLKKQGANTERATAAPNGQFYALRILTSRSFHGSFTHLRVFKADGTLLFELNKGEWTDEDDKRSDGSPRWSSLWGAPFIAPNGEYMVVFHNGGGWIGPVEPEPTFLNFYDMTGTLIKHINKKDFRQYDFIPEILDFSRDGSHALLMGLNTKVRGFDVNGHRIRQVDLIVFDAQGNLIRRIEGRRTRLEGFGSKGLTVARNAIKRLLEPERVKARLQRGHASGLAEFRLLEDGKRGVYANGPTLYLFELNKAHGLVSAFYREFQGLYSD